MRAIHQKIAALMSAIFFFLAGNVAWGERNMGSRTTRSRPATPRVYTTRSGGRYVRSIDVIRSEAGRREITLQMQDKKADAGSDSGKTLSRKSKS